jgi:serine phosphatase RsbU (regulator of sigma subunit)
MMREGARSRLRLRVALVVALGAVLVSAGVALLLNNTIALRGSADSASRADLYLLRVANVERLVVDAETGLRGQIITGLPLFLQPLHRAQAQLPRAVAALRQSASESRAYQRQTGSLLAAVHRYMSVYVPEVLALSAQDLRVARSFLLTLEGKQLVDHIRAMAGQLEQSLSASQSARQLAARRTANHSIGEAIAVLVVLTLLIGGLGAYLGHLVVTRDRAREQSEETTRVLQESILPSGVPRIPGCELAVRFIPGGGPVSGDFFDVLEVEPDTWALVIGDVCGKGAAAAAATAMARWTLRSSLARGATPGEALQLLNDVVLGHQPDDRFITAACLKLTLEPELALVDVACAGHPAPILVPAAGTPAAVPAGGDLLGVLPTIRLEPAELQLRPGDSLVAYTDGVTDQGPEIRLTPEQALRDHSAGADAEELAGVLEDVAHRPVGRHPDDIAIMAIRFLGRGGKVHAFATASTAEDAEA